MFRNLRTTNSRCRFRPLVKAVFAIDGSASVVGENARRLSGDDINLLASFCSCRTVQGAYNRFNQLRREPSPQRMQTGSHVMQQGLVLFDSLEVICPVTALDQAFITSQLLSKAYRGIISTEPAALVKQLRDLQCRVLDYHMTTKMPKLIRTNTTDYKEFCSTVQALVDDELLVVPFGEFDFGDLAGGLPACPYYGFTRGTPIDRFYLTRFITEYVEMMHGKTLEIGGNVSNVNAYGLRQIREYETLDIKDGVGVTKVGDVEDSGSWEPESFDTILMFNVLEHCVNPSRVLSNCRYWLRNHGRVFVLTPAAQRVHCDPIDCVRFNQDWYQSHLKPLFSHVDIRTFGNLATTVAALAGVSAEELSSGTLNKRDQRYPTVVAIVAQR